MIRPQTCPVCDKELVAADGSTEFFPFCSERCRNVDLYRWSIGKYVIVEDIDPETIDEQRFDQDQP